MGSVSASLTTPTLGIATATSLAFAPTTGGLVGTTAADNASAGRVGEVISSVITSGSPVSVTNATTTNLTSISLTAGDWDVVGNTFFTTAGGTTYTSTSSQISTVSQTFPADSSYAGRNVWPGAAPQVSPSSCSVPYHRLNINSTTTVYLVIFTDFLVGTMNVSGFISARRVR